jgi:hypothetical protein
MLTRPQAAPLRFIATRMAIPEMDKVARQPGVTEAFRLTIQYHDARHPDQVATMVKMQGSANARIDVGYRRASDQVMWLDYQLSSERFHVFCNTLRRLGFDKLDDMENIPWYGADLWLVERAAVSFHHDLILAPDRVSGTYMEIVKLIQDSLREVLRPVNP